jgi:GntR family transcriptional regulator
LRLASATQTIGAAAASKSDAGLLGIEPGSPVLRCERTTCTEDGRAVIFAEHVFPAGRTEFVVELAAAPAASMAPSGLRLVE